MLSLFSLQSTQHFLILYWSYIACLTALGKAEAFFPGLPEHFESYQYFNTTMHPDAGAIIGISLAGSVLLVALIFLCIIHLPCCNEGRKVRRRRTSRPSTSSRTAIANLGFTGSTRNLQTLSALDLQSRNQSHFYNGTGLVNPVWQLHCSCEMLAVPAAAANQRNLQNLCRNCQLPVSSCRCYNQEQSTRNDSPQCHSPGSHSTSSFQYHEPQLQPPDSPPPYPGIHSQAMIGSSNANSSLRSTISSPPPYSPKRFT
ncbi:hypothetical protein Ocin01_06566 [Orchesella cincta]|uniref:Uncharacterized protein n=1 Tax=Orchesella cincta TaxID=48709 RepID=A0A1D2N581_ORCCI|nr:hypothetical protein Ocin01_06566 [Orchesella cincta]